VSFAKVPSPVEEQGAEMHHLRLSETCPSTEAQNHLRYKEERQRCIGGEHSVQAYLVNAISVQA
jgi:hypothetical protein